MSCYSLVVAVAFAEVVQNFKHARTAFDGLVEVKNEMRRIFQYDVTGQFRLQRRRDALPACRLPLAPLSAPRVLTKTCALLRSGVTSTALMVTSAPSKLISRAMMALSSRFTSSFTRSSRCFMM